MNLHINDQLFCAIVKKDIATTQMLLTSGANINGLDRGDEGLTVWQMVLSQERLDTVQFCLGFGADPNIRDDANRTALGICGTVHRLDIIECLIAAGADPDAMEYDLTLLHIAAVFDNVALMEAISAHCSEDLFYLQDSMFQTPYEKALACKSYKCMRFLVFCGKAIRSSDPKVEEVTGERYMPPKEW